MINCLEMSLILLEARLHTRNARDNNLIKQDISNTASNINKVIVQQREAQGINNLKTTRESTLKQ